MWTNLKEKHQSRAGFGEQPRPTGNGESGEAQWGKINSNIIRIIVAVLSPFNKGIGGTHLPLPKTLTDT